MASESAYAGIVSSAFATRAAGRGPRAKNVSLAYAGHVSDPGHVSEWDRGIFKFPVTAAAFRSRRQLSGHGGSFPVTAAAFRSRRRLSGHGGSFPVTVAAFRSRRQLSGHGGSFPVTVAAFRSRRQLSGHASDLIEGTRRVVETQNSLHRIE
jgi:hypothetical protein